MFLVVTSLSTSRIVCKLGFGCKYFGIDHERSSHKSRSCGKKRQFSLYIYLLDYFKLYYTVFHEYDVIVRRTLFRNTLDESLIIRRCYSCTQDFDTDDFYLTQLSGSWARERQMVTKKLCQGISLVESTRGASSHQVGISYVVIETTIALSFVYLVV